MTKDQKWQPNWVEKWTLLWSIISGTFVVIFLAIISTNLTKNNEIETRLYQIKTDTYKKFLDEYYKDFASPSITSLYEKKYDELIENNLQDAYNWHATKEDFLKIKSAKCYYQSPNACTDNDYQYWIIGWNQD